MSTPHLLSSTNGGQCWEILARMDCGEYEFSQGPALTPNLFSLFSECPGLCSPPQLCVSLHEVKAPIFIPLVEITLSVGSQSCPSSNASLHSLDGSPFFLPKSTYFFSCSASLKSVQKYPYLQKARRVSIVLFYVSQLPGGWLSDGNELWEGGKVCLHCSFNSILSDS
jgi:hypothetical protein